MAGGPHFPHKETTIMLDPICIDAGTLSVRGLGEMYKTIVKGNCPNCKKDIRESYAQMRFQGDSFVVVTECTRCGDTHVLIEGTILRRDTCVSLNPEHTAKATMDPAEVF
jgi:hypothetical protein